MIGGREVGGVIHDNSQTIAKWYFVSANHYKVANIAIRSKKTIDLL